MAGVRVIERRCSDPDCTIVPVTGLWGANGDGRVYNLALDPSVKGGGYCELPSVQSDEFYGTVFEHSVVAGAVVHSVARDSSS